MRPPSFATCSDEGIDSAADAVTATLCRDDAPYDEPTMLAGMLCACAALISASHNPADLLVDAIIELQRVGMEAIGIRVADAIWSDPPPWQRPRLRVVK
jgi:hypothetical protein